MNESAVPPSTPPRPPGQGLRVGDTLDRYTIVQQIGAGGMATVWKGHDPLLDRHVAIKELNVHLFEVSQQDVSQRFRQEAELNRKLAKPSPHLVQVLDFIDEPRGLFIVMEYIDGPNLEQMLIQNQGPLDTRQAMGIVSATALALQAIHAHQVVHRDLKPANILMPRAGGLKVGDFGMATMVGPQQAMSVGTVRYMAPELFRDEAVDGRADLYSLGMIAYEMLAGREKFNEAFRVVLRDQRNEPLRWMKWHTNLRAKAPPLSQLNPAVPAPLSELVSRLMEKDLPLRVASPQELLGAMRRLLKADADRPAAGVASSSDVSDEMPVQPSSDPTAALPKPRRLPYILAAILLVQACLGGGLWMYRQSRHAAELAQRHEQARQQLAQAAQAYKDQSLDDARDLYQRVAADWADDPAYQRASQAGVHLVTARQALDAGQYQDALSQIEAARKLDVFKGDTLDTLRQEAQTRLAFEGETHAIATLMDEGNLGMADTRLGRMRGSTEQETQALQRLHQRLDALQVAARDARTLAEAQAERDAQGLSQGIRFLEAQLMVTPSDAVRQVLEQWKQLHRHDTLIQQATAHQRQGRLSQALAALNEAQKLSPSDDTARRISQVRVATLLARAIEHEEKGNHNAAADAYTAILGLDKDHTQAKAALARIQVSGQREAFLRSARSSQTAGQHDEAVQQFLNALELGDDADVRDELRQARVSQAMAQARAAVDQQALDKALERVQAALELSPDDPQAQAMLTLVRTRQAYQTHFQQGDELRRQGDYAEAQRQYLRAQRLWRTPQVIERIHDTEVLQLLAQARYYAQLQEWRTARALLMTLLEKRPHDEARKLLDEVNAKLPAPTEDEHGQP